MYDSKQFTLFVLQHNINYGVFEISGIITNKDNTNLGCGFKEELNTRSGIRYRSCKFYLAIGDGISIPLKISASADRETSYKKVYAFYKNMKEGSNILCSGSTRYIRDNVLEFSVFRYSKNEIQLTKNLVYQPIVFNQMCDDRYLLAYIMKGEQHKHSAYIFDTAFPKQVKLQRGDFIVSQGRITMNPDELSNKIHPLITLTSFVGGTWHKQMYGEELFKDDEIKAIFNGTDPDLVNILTDEREE